MSPEGLAALREAGRAYGPEHPGELDARSASCRPDDLAILGRSGGRRETDRIELIAAPVRDASPRSAR